MWVFYLQGKLQNKEDPYDFPKNYDSRSSNVAVSSDTSTVSAKAAPPSVSVKPAFGRPILRNSQPAEEEEEETKLEEEGSEQENTPKSVLRKVKIFEEMDHKARMQRMQELQEAQNARV